MFKLESGVLDTTKLVSNILLLILLAGNLFFSVQYIENIKASAVVQTDNTIRNLKIERFLQEFITIVLNTQGSVSVDDRIKLENDIHQVGDADLLTAWNNFVASPDPKTAQANAIRLMSLLSGKMLEQ